MSSFCLILCLRPDVPLLADSGMKSLRRQIERCDSFAGVIMLHSLAGGTGAGLGSRLMKEIRMDYEKTNLLTYSVAPFSTGDTPLQHYNSLLTLSHLQQYVDGILLMHNDELQRMFAQASLKGLANPHQNIVPSYNFQQINSYLAGCLADVVAPLDYYQTETK